MTKHAKLTILPGPIEIPLPKGTRLIDVLFEYGVEFPCGGRSICNGCHVKVMQGEWEISEADRSSFTSTELKEGYRLACQGRIYHDLTLWIEQWQAPVLSEHSAIQWTPQEGYGIAVDIGTTTLVAQLVDRQTGNVLATRSALNPQTRFGSDIISRINCAVYENGSQHLTKVIRNKIESFTSELLQWLPTGAHVKTMILVGNTAMHHFFCGKDLSPLSKFPFESPHLGIQHFTPTELNWTFDQIETITFLPCLGGFIGSDILAGALAIDMHHSHHWQVLLDLGTNGEILVGNHKQICAVSTAAGPAFEGGNISIGMRADNGAIYKVLPQNDGLRCMVLGSTAAKGICGSGLVDAVAVGLTQQWIQPNGRINTPTKTLTLCDDLTITQKDIRQLQLAKAAIAAGLEIVLEHLNLSKDEITTINLAGAFGNYVARESAHKIGLLNFNPKHIKPVGNAALHGAKLALNLEPNWINEICQKTSHFSLSAHPNFQNLYVSHMGFQHN